MVVSLCCGCVRSSNDVTQKIKKTLNETHKKKQYISNNGFCETNKDRSSRKYNSGENCVQCFRTKAWLLRLKDVSTCKPRL